MVLVFFFFKQKTAYEMRISDWSSDVCSSDLAARGDPLADSRHDGADQRPPLSVNVGPIIHPYCCQTHNSIVKLYCIVSGNAIHRRSEEHTSELQSLMRISYAVFCLKKKKHTRNTKIQITITNRYKYQAYI